MNTGDIELGASARVEEIQARRAAVQEANATPLPGSLRDAFSIAPEIKVGEYVVRPFYDGDYDLLTELGNPLAELMGSHIEGRESKQDYVPRGTAAYEICHLLTNDIEQMVDEIRSGTFRENARKRFFKLRLAGLLAIHGAVMKQLGIYWSTTIGYTSSDESDDGGVKKNAQP